MAKDKSDGYSVGNQDPDKRGRGGEPPKNPKTEPPTKPGKSK